MIVLWVITAVCLLAPLVAGRGRTFAALRTAAGRLARIMPAFLLMPALFATGITLVPQEAMRRMLGQDSGADKYWPTIFRMPI